MYFKGTASEATLVAILSARAKTIREQREVGAEEEAGSVMTRLVCYGSQQAHSSVERAGLLAGVRMRLLDTDEDLAITGDILEAAVTEDRAKGLIPFCCVATLGTTSSCAFDDLKTLGPVCQKEVETLILKHK